MRKNGLLGQRIGNAEDAEKSGVDSRNESKNRSHVDKAVAGGTEQFPGNFGHRGFGICFQFGSRNIV